MNQLSMPIQNSISNRIAYFISPHGFGHAARGSAVMSAMQAIDPFIRFEIFTSVPCWFFQESLSENFGYHQLITDVGLVQKTSLNEDIDKTIQRLNDFLPFDDAQISDLSQQINELKCRLMICDIAPMGIAVACKAGIPSVLIENFTWDWIYDGYVEDNQGIKKHSEYLRSIFETVDYHIQTEPLCQHRKAHLATLPISRKIRTPHDEIREKLGISDKKKVVIITMGGIQEKYDFLKQLTEQQDIHFIIPGGNFSADRSQSEICERNLTLLPHNSEFFHPDLINAADAVIGKVGYSTLAEIYHAGVPFGYIPRPIFPESEKLVRFIEKEMAGSLIDEAEFQNGKWLSSLESVLSLPRIERNCPNGAEQVSDFICKKLGIRN